MNNSRTSIIRKQIPNFAYVSNMKMCAVLSIMFNAMLTHGFNPDDLLRSTIISIPKDSWGSLCSSDNYRGISLSNSICKLFDYVFIHMQKDGLQTCDMQFGFKSNHSTVLCTAILYRNN